MSIRNSCAQRKISLSYASNVINGRFLLCEEEIRKNDWASYLYAKEVVKDMSWNKGKKWLDWEDLNL